MKKLLTLLSAATLIASLASAQTGKWNQNYDKALAEAKKAGKFLLIDFSGSDWCPWCIKLDKEVFSQKEFQEYAKNNLVLMLADFPRRKQLSNEIKNQNKALAEKYAIQGFPTVVLLNSNGETVGQTGYQPGGAKAYVDHLKGILSCVNKK
jgi:protein disulfide-isomerase